MNTPSERVVEWELEFRVVELEAVDGITLGYLLVAERDGPFRRSVRVHRGVGILEALRDMLLTSAQGGARRPGRILTNMPWLAEALSSVEPPLGVAVAVDTGILLTSAMMEPVMDALRDETPRGGHRCIYSQGAYSLFDGHAEVVWVLDMIVDAAHAAKLATRLERAESVTFVAQGPVRGAPGPSLTVVLHDRDRTLGPLMVSTVSESLAESAQATPDMVLQAWSKPPNGPAEVVKAVRLARRGPHERARAAKVFQGPVAIWPSPARTLLDFAGACGHSLDLRGAVAMEALEAMAAVWRATVFEDFLGTTTPFDDRTMPEARAFVEKCARIKRQRYPTDPRVFEIVDTPNGHFEVLGGFVVGNAAPDQ